MYPVPHPHHARRAASPGSVGLRGATGIALLIATTVASMAAFLDAYVVNVAVPAIQRDLGASVAALQWSLTGYLVTVAALLLVAGGLADRFGRRRILTVGLTVLLVSSVLAALAPSVGALIAARFLQGAGAALVTPSSLALLNGTLRVADRARAIGIWVGLATLGTTLGPYFGGWLVDHVSWRAVFLLNLPLSLAGLVALRWVPESGAPRAGSFDVLGSVLGVLGIGGAVYALTEGAASGWAEPNVLVAAVLAGVALAALPAVERRAPAPLLRGSLFASRQFDAINATTVLFYGALAAASYLVVLQLQLRLGYSATQAGAALIPNSAVLLALSPLSGGLVARFGPRRLMVAGILLVTVAWATLSGLAPGDAYVTAVLPAALLWGLGLALTVAPLTAAVLAAVPDADLGEASAVNDAAARVGAVVAIALVPALLGAGGAKLADALVDGFGPAMVALAVAGAASALICAVFATDVAVPEPAYASEHP
jgi:EmrB/QacA subfamily drug resistance transporter